MSEDVTSELEVDVADVVAAAKVLLAQPQKKFDFAAANVAEAVASLTEMVPRQPGLPAFWLTLADAQMMQGRLSACKDSLARALSLLYPAGYDTHVRRRQKSQVRSGTLDPFSVLVAPFTRQNFDRVRVTYRQLAARGMADRRLRFYIFNMLKAVDDLATAFLWLDCDDLDDAFLAHYLRESYLHDYFDYIIRAWFQKPLFTRVAAASPMESNFELDFFTCLLNNAAANERDAVAELEGYEPESEDEAGEGGKDEDALILEINKDSQMWTVLRASLLRMQGKMTLAHIEFKSAIASGHSQMITLAATLGLAWIKLENFEPQDAFDLFDQLRTDVCVAAEADKAIISGRSAPMLLQREVVESDACVGAGQCLRLLGKAAEAQTLFSIALQADSFCGEALWHNTVHDCMRNFLTGAKQSLELLLNAERSSLANPDFDKIIASGPQMRFIRMPLDRVIPSKAAVHRKDLVLEHGTSKEREALQDLCIAGNTDQVWKILFAFLAERRVADADRAVSVLMESSQNGAVLPLILDLATCMVKHKIERGSEDPAHRSLLGRFHVARGSWLDKNLAMSDEAFAEFATALEILDENNAEHRKVLRKLLWKRHR